MWLLSPTDRMPLMKSVFIGITLELLCYVAFVFLLAYQAAGGDLEPTPPVQARNGITIMYDVFAFPVLNAVGMATVFEISGIFRRFAPYVCAALSATLTLIDGGDLANTLYRVIVFTGPAIQYVLFRDKLRMRPTIVCVALANSAMNMTAILLALALA